MGSDRIVFRPTDGPDVMVDLAECDSWATTSLPWGDAAVPPSVLYRTPSGEYFRQLRLDDLTRMGVNCTASVPRRFAAVPKDAAERFIAEPTTVGLRRPEPARGPTRPRSKVTEAAEPMPSGAADRQPERDRPNGPVGVGTITLKPSSESTTYWVSYAWNEESKSALAGLCDEAKRRGIQVLRDETNLGLGESITQFMQSLGAGDRVLVILSGRYLKSQNCMYELWEVWRNCKMDVEEFRHRIRVCRLPDAKMMKPTDRVRISAYWKKEFAKLNDHVREHAQVLETLKQPRNRPIICTGYRENSATRLPC